MSDLQDQFGSIDIYLFDQLLKSRLVPGMRVLDAGSGRGRNLVYLTRIGCEVFGVDRDAANVDRTREVVRAIRPATPADRFRVEDIQALSFDELTFDFVISSAVLHFAADTATFDAMLHEMWRVLAAGGILFVRLASSIGIEDLIEPTHDGRARLPDGTERFLVDERLLMSWTARWAAALLDPIKTTVVQNQRAMTTWVVQKPQTKE